MDLGRPLTVVTATVDGDVLAALAGADAAFTPPAIRSLIGNRSEEGIRKTLARLVAQGIVHVDQVGNARAYRLNRDHLAAEHIVGLARLKASLFERIEEEVRDWSPTAELVALFGSAARGSMSPSSDIDLFVVRPDAVDVDHPGWNRQVHDLQDHITNWTGNDCRVLEYSVADVLAGLASQGDRVLDDIADDGIVLGGRARSLRMLEVNHR